MSNVDPGDTLWDGMRAAFPVAAPTLALGVSFGLVAKPVMGTVAPIAMSILIFSGSAQFAALSVLQGGGAAAAAVGAGLLMNVRWLPMSFALAPSLQGSTQRRTLESQAIVDASFVIASRPDGRFEPRPLVGATLLQASAWTAGTVIGTLGSGFIGNPDQFGLDAVFPAFYLSLLVASLRQRRDRNAFVAVALAAFIAASLLPFAPPGLPITASSVAALVGLRNS
ncbi:MAG: branched-chain amino acid permease [Streptosporangiales bacterium]|nr:branched-chain amino acid permease [Streptosporangiales bacterium]